MPTTTLFLFQMAKLEGSISTYFGEIAGAPKSIKLTYEARSIANLSQEPGGHKSRDMNKMERSFEGIDSETDTHPSGSDHYLASGIIAGQCG